MRFSTLLLSIIYTISLQPVKIAIIDTGIDLTNLDVPVCSDSIDFTTDGNLNDGIMHGTEIARIISNRIKIKNYCLLVIKIFNYKGDTKAIDSTKAIRYARIHGASFINLSYVGYQKNLAEQREITKAIDNGIRIVAASGNDKKNLSECIVYPACSDSRIYIVGYDNIGNISNYGKYVKYLDSGLPDSSIREIGSSFAAPRILVKIINGELK